MKSADYIDAIKERHNLKSDYAVAKRLGVHPNRVSNYRCGRSDFDVDLMPKVAELLEINPIIVFAEIGASRARTEFERNCFEKFADMAKDTPTKQRKKNCQVENIVKSATYTCRTHQGLTGTEKAKLIFWFLEQEQRIKRLKIQTRKRTNRKQEPMNGQKKKRLDKRKAGDFLRIRAKTGSVGLRLEHVKP